MPRKRKLDRVEAAAYGGKTLWLAVAPVAVAPVAVAPVAVAPVAVRTEMSFCLFCVEF